MGGNTLSKKVMQIEAILKMKGTKQFESNLAKIKEQTKIFSAILNKSDRESSASSLRLEKDALSGTKAVNKSMIMKEKEASGISDLAARTDTLTKIGDRYNTNQSESLKLASASGFQLAKNGDILDKAGNKQDDYFSGMDKNVGVLNKFNMSQLGVMFAGMALNRSMSNLNATSREWLGIGGLMSDMMGITMLGANMDLLELGVLPLFDAMINLPPSAQKALGLVSIGLETMGGVMMVGGQLALGLNSTLGILSAMTGLPTSMVFSAKGFGKIRSSVSGLMTSLGISKGVKGAARFIAIALLVNEIKNDIEDGEITAAIGDIVGIYGIFTGNKWAMAIGVSLKFVGDEDIQRGVARSIITIVDMVQQAVEWIGDSMWSALTFDFKNIKSPTFITDLKKIMAEERLDMALEGKTQGFSARKTKQQFETQSMISALAFSDMSASNVRLTPGVGLTGGEPNILFQNTYNVNVSDKREFEQILRANNETLKNDVMRSVKV